MTELNYDFTAITAGQSLEDAFASLVAPDTWDEDKWEGFDPAGWAIRNGVNGGNKTILVANDFAYPDGDYRVTIDFEFSANQDYRDSYCACTRTQADGSCYLVNWSNDTDGRAIYRSSGGQFAVLTELTTELIENSAIVGSPENREFIGVRATGTGATVTIEAFNTKTGAALFSYDDTDAARIVGNGKAALLNGNATAGGTTSRLYALHIDDGQSGSNPGLRVPATDAAGSVMPDTTGINVVVYDAVGGTELFQGVAAIASGVLEIDDDALGAVNDTVYVAFFKDGATEADDIEVFADLTVVDLSTSNNSDD